MLGFTWPLKRTLEASNKQQSPLAPLKLLLESSSDPKGLEFIFFFFGKPSALLFSKGKNKIQKDTHIASWRSNDLENCILMSEGIKDIWIKLSLVLLGGNGSRSRGRAWMAVKVCTDYSEHKASCEGWPGMSQVLQNSLLTTCQLTQQERKCEGFIIIIHFCFFPFYFPPMGLTLGSC